MAKIRASDALQARKQAAGTLLFYWRYSIGTSSERVLIGIFDPKAPPKSLTETTKVYSFFAAVHAAELLALTHQQLDLPRFPGRFKGS